MHCIVAILCIVFWCILYSFFHPSGLYICDNMKVTSFLYETEPQRFGYEKLSVSYYHHVLPYLCLYMKIM